LPLEMVKQKFEPGALVFGKVKGYPPWPARVTAIASKDRYKVYFYGTYETGSLKAEDMWPYNQETKAKFAQKNMKKKGYTEGIDQIENTPEIAAVEEDVPLPVTPQVAKKVVEKAVVEKVETPKTGKRKAAEMETTPATRKADSAAESVAESEKEEKLSRSGRVLKPKKFGDVAGTPVAGSPKPEVAATEGEQPPTKKQARGSLRGAAQVKKEEEVSKEGEKKPEQQAEPRKMWVKVKNTDDLIEINLDKDRPESFESEEARLEWEMASARKALKFKKRVESGEFIPPEIKKKLEEKEKMSEEDKVMVSKERQLERRKQKLRWLKIEQKLVDIDIAVKTALHLERPAPDRCISALEELGELAVVPLMLKKQPDIVTTIRRLRKYIGPQSYCNWPDVEARQKMEKAVKDIQAKADQIYNKFKSNFAFQEGDKTFWEQFESEVSEFKTKTAGMEESKVLSLIRDPTRPLSNSNPLSDDEDL